MPDMQKSNDFLTSLIDPVRTKILRLFIINDTEQFTVGEMARRAIVSERVAANEIKLLQGLNIVREFRGEGKNAKERKNTTRYVFNSASKYANALSTFVHEVTPEQFNHVERALKGTGRLRAIVLSGIFTGDVNRPADLIVVGDFVNEKRLEKAVRSFEPKYGREIRYAIFSTPEFRYRLTIHDKLLRATFDYPHRILLNKNNLI